MSEQEDEEFLISKILRDIGVSHEELRAKQKERFTIFDQILKMPTLGFKRLALDSATIAGAFGDWRSAFLITERLLKEGDKSYSTKIWHIRSLIELEHFSEALALSTSADWPKQLKTHAKYLTGTCFLRLNMKKQAQSSFEEVRTLDPNYPGIPEIVSD